MFEKLPCHLVDAQHAVVHDLDFMKQLLRLKGGVQATAYALKKRKADAFLGM
ncbi:hypothetical protein D3C87_2059320 [compost metagenome]